MKRVLIFLTAAIALSSARAEPPPGYCEVSICNKISRWSLDITSHVKDYFGEACFPGIISVQDAVVGREINSETRWYQGSQINPTKRSVTKVKQVGTCTPAPVAKK